MNPELIESKAISDSCDGHSALEKLISYSFMKHELCLVYTYIIQ